MRITPLTQTDLRVYWAMISFNITEPVFIVESPEHRILLQFTAPEDLTLGWIDDYQPLASPTTMPTTKAMERGNGTGP